MSTTRISFAGLASGLDSSAIIKSLVALERRPIGLLQQKKSRFDQQAKLFGTLRIKLDKLQDLAKELKLQSKVLDYTATADTENVVQLTPGDNAVPGTYGFKINQLARAQTRASSSQANNTTVYTSGELKFDFAGQGQQDVNISITQDGPTGPPLTLGEIAAQVNEKSNGKIKADVVFEGGSSGGYRLTFTSGLEGEDGAFTVQETTGFGSLKDMIVGMNGPKQPDNSGLLVLAQNAELEINGLVVERSSNKITDIIPGVTIQLTGEAKNKEVKITVGTDLEASSKKMQDFVDAYNDVVDFVNEQSKVEVSQGDTGKDTTVKANALAGDSTLRSVRNRIRSFLSATVETGNEAVTMLSQIGIDADRDGRLKFDKSKFEDAVSEDPVAVTKIFSHPTSGMGTRLTDTIETFTDSVDGLIKSRTDGIGRVNKDIDRQIERLERRIGSFEDNLTRRYANLEQLIGSMESQRGALLSLQQK